MESDPGVSGKAERESMQIAEQPQAAAVASSAQNGVPATVPAPAPADPGWEELRSRAQRGSQGGGMFSGFPQLAGKRKSPSSRDEEGPANQAEAELHPKEEAERSAQDGTNSSASASSNGGGGSPSYKRQRK